MCAEMHTYLEEKPTFVQGNNFQLKQRSPFVIYTLAMCNRSILFARNFSLHGYVL